MEKYFDVKPAFGDGTAITDTIAYTLTTTPQIAAIPLAFCNQFVRIRPMGANLQYFFTTSPTAAIVAAVPTAAGQQAATLGESVANGTTLPVVVPGIALNGQNRTIYFCWVGDAAGSGVWITKGSGVPGLTLGDGR